MAQPTPLRRALYGAGVGLVLGALVIYVGLVGILTGKTAVTQEPTYEQRSQTAFMNMARDDWTFKTKDANFILGRIAVDQMRTGDIEGTLGRIDKLTLDPDVVRNVAVYDYLHNTVQPTEAPRPDVIKTAKEMANKIGDPLLKADALRRVAEIEIRLDPKAAKETFAAAATAVPTPMPPPVKPAVFNPYMLLWPVGLAIFGFLLVWLMLGVVTGPRGKAATEDEDEDEEEDETPRVAEAAPMMAEAPVDAPMAEAPMAEAPIVDDVPLADSPAPALAAPMPARPSALAGAVPAGAPAAAGTPDKKTMMARAPQPTMLAKQGQATQLAKQGVPTKLADTTEAMPIDDKPMKTGVKK